MENHWIREFFISHQLYVTDGMLVMNGTTSVPKSILRYTVDKVRQGSETEV